MSNFRASNERLRRGKVWPRGLSFSLTGHLARAFIWLATQLELDLARRPILCNADQRGCPRRPMRRPALAVSHTTLPEINALRVAQEWLYCVLHALRPLQERSANGAAVLEQSSAVSGRS
eukprot:89260-Chlamydomonas_euryale.AAC.3